MTFTAHLSSCDRERERERAFSGALKSTQSFGWSTILNYLIKLTVRLLAHKMIVQMKRPLSWLEQKRKKKKKKPTLTCAIAFTCLWIQVVKSQTTIIPPPTSTTTTTQSPSQVCVAVTSKPAPDIGLYALKSSDSDEICVLAQFSAYLEVEHERYVSFHRGTVNETISKCDKPNGSSSHQAKLAIDFECGHQLCLTITKDDQLETSYLASLDGQYKISDGSYLTFSNSTIGSIIRTNDLEHYYKCNAEQAIVLDYNSMSPLDGNLLFLSNFSMEAFRSTADQRFKLKPEICELDYVPTSWLVDVGIFVCLVALVAVVLVAFCIHQHRKRTAGESPYQPM